MPIRVQCPQCGKDYNVGDDKAGRRFQCKGCQATVVVPTLGAEADESDPFAGIDDFGADFTSPGRKSAGAKKKCSDGKGTKGKSKGNQGKSESRGLPVGVWIGIGVAAVAVVAVGIFLMTRGGEDDEAEPAAGNNSVADRDANDNQGAATNTPGPGTQDTPGDLTADELATVKEQPFEPPSTPPAGPLHLAYMTDDTIGLIRISPQKLQAATWIMNSIPASLLADAPFPLKTLEETVLWIAAGAGSHFPENPDDQFALKFSEAISLDELALTQLPTNSRAYLHDANTVVFGRGERFERMFSGSGSSNPLASSLRPELFNADVYIAFQLQSEAVDLDWSTVHAMLAPLGEVGEGLIQVRQVQLAFRATESPIVKVWLTFDDEVGATSFRAILDQQLPQLVRTETSIPALDRALRAVVPSWTWAHQGNAVSVEIRNSNQLQTVLGAIVSQEMAPALLSSPELNPNLLLESNMKRIMLAAQNYHDVYLSFPVSSDTESYDVGETPLLSWRVHLLPYIGEAALYEEFHFDEPWDSPHNIQFVERMPAVFDVRGGEASDIKVGMTRFVRADGEGTLFQNGYGGGLRDIADGASNTAFCFVVSPEHAVPWTKPEDIVIDFALPIWPQLAIPQGDDLLVGFCDGAARFVPRTLDEINLKRLLLHRDGGGLMLP